MIFSAIGKKTLGLIPELLQNTEGNTSIVPRHGPCTKLSKTFVRLPFVWTTAATEHITVRSVDFCSLREHRAIIRDCNRISGH